VEEVLVAALVGLVLLRDVHGVGDVLGIGCIDSREWRKVRKKLEVVELLRRMSMRRKIRWRMLSWIEVEWRHRYCLE